MSLSWPIINTVAQYMPITDNEKIKALCDSSNVPYSAVEEIQLNESITLNGNEILFLYVLLYRHILRHMKGFKQLFNYIHDKRTDMPDYFNYYLYDPRFNGKVTLEMDYVDDYMDIDGVCYLYNLSRYYCFMRKNKIILDPYNESETPRRNLYNINKIMQLDYSTLFDLDNDLNV